MGFVFSSRFRKVCAKSLAGNVREVKRKELQET